jgi:hypothetical protein
MSIENIDFWGVCSLIAEKNDLLGKIDSEIAEQLLSLESLPESAEQESFSVHCKIEQLRFDRNRVRSEYLDLSSLQKTLKRRHFEHRLMDAISMSSPLSHFEIERATAFQETPAELEESILIQQRITCYRKLENSFKDQISMLRQKHMAQLLGKEDLEWEARLEHALSKSRQYFSRQCGKIKFIRERLSVLAKQEYSHAYYQAAVSVLGREVVNEYANQLTMTKQAA